MKQFFRQTFNLLAENKLHSSIVIVGTAVTMAFVMMVVMTFDFRAADLAPESHRSRTVYMSPGHINMVDGTNHSSGMGKIPFDALFTACPGVELATWSGYLAESSVSMPGGADKHRFFVNDVAANWFDMFDYNFIAGKPFTEAEYDGHPREAVVSRTVARKLTGGDPASIVGREILVNFRPVKVTGVYEDVSQVFQTAYSDVLLPFTGEKNVAMGGLAGRRRGVLLLAPGADVDDVAHEVARREEMLNSRGNDFVFHLERLYNHVDYTFFRDAMINPRLVYGLLIAVLLIVPALGLSGLINAQMQSRLGEIAIRKAYGATNRGIMGRLFAENLVATFIGAVIGYILSCLLVWACRRWIFAEMTDRMSGTMGDIGLDGSLFVHPVIALYALAACLVFTTVATVVPAWMSTHRSIAITLKGGE